MAVRFERHTEQPQLNDAQKDAILLKAVQEPCDKSFLPKPGEKRQKTTSAMMSRFPTEPTAEPVDVTYYHPNPNGPARIERRRETQQHIVASRERS